MVVGPFYLLIYFFKQGKESSRLRAPSGRVQMDTHEVEAWGGVTVGNSVTAHRVRAWVGRAFTAKSRRRAAVLTATLLLVSGIAQLDAIPAAAAKPLPLSFTCESNGRANT